MYGECAVHACDPLCQTCLCTDHVNNSTATRGVIGECGISGLEFCLRLPSHAASVCVPTTLVSATMMGC